MYRDSYVNRIRHIKGKANPKSYFKCLKFEIGRERWLMDSSILIDMLTNNFCLCFGPRNGSGRKKQIKTIFKVYPYYNNSSTSLITHDYDTDCQQCNPPTPKEKNIYQLT